MTKSSKKITTQNLTPVTQTDTEREVILNSLSPSNVINKNKARRWCFTLHKYSEEDVAHLTHVFETKGLRYIFGRELGKSGKTPHLQGYFEGKSAIRFTTIKGWNPRLHLEKAKGTIVENCIYCSKEGTYQTNIDKYVWLDRIEMILNEEYKDIQWRPFQEQLLDTISVEPDKRKIIWCHESIGNIGKSFLCKYIALKYPGVIIASGKAGDVNNQINTMMTSSTPEEPRIIILDIPRHNLEYINYGCIESIKNGCIYSGKYEGGKCLFRIPHVLIFANEEPNYDKWSKDRYDVRELSQI